MMPLVRGYRDRFEAATGAPWMSLDANRRQIVAVARWLDASGADTERWLDAWFADSWAKTHRWPWKHAAKDPGRFRPGSNRAEKSAEERRLEVELDALRGAGPRCEEIMERLNTLREEGYRGASRR